MRDTWLWWSSGKDSAWALHALRRSGRHRVTRLVTTIDREAARVAVHAVGLDLLEAQARAAGVPLRYVELPFPASNDVYEAGVAGVLREAQEAKVAAMAFGDLFLEDVRAYRLRLLEGTGLEPIFPLWGCDTAELAREMVAAGLRARLTCVDLRVLDAAFAGRRYDADFLDGLPAAVDRCGENGEFHTFATDGPMFDQPLHVRSASVTERDGFAYADLRLQA